ncbi:MAG: YicC family protein [Candidatus Acidiferrum sp.]
MSETVKFALQKTNCLSMTGFAQARIALPDMAVRITVKSVNHRFLDLKMRLPEGFDVYEPRLRQVVRDTMYRGHVELVVIVDSGAGLAVHVNKDLVRAYLRAAEELRQETRAATDMDVVALLRLPGVISGAASSLPQLDADQEKFGVALEGCLREALGKLDDMRSAEGKQLVEDLRARLALVAEQAERVRALAVSLRPAFASRLEARLKELLTAAPIDPARLAQEAALLAERSDISEELDRLRSHVRQFATLLDAGGEVGKKLDFLLQEMHREANTMLSKTPGVAGEALEITGLALEIKASIEKLREQVQNIE